MKMTGATYNDRVRVVELILGLATVLAWAHTASSSPSDHLTLATPLSLSATVGSNINKMTMTVPNVVGQTQAAAGAAIRGAMLAVGAVTQEYSGTVMSGTVISQAPPAGADAAMGTTVNLVVSKGPQPVSVTAPDVSGKTVAEAQAILAAAGLAFTVTEQASNTVPAGLVISQTPLPGASAVSGSSVNLVVSAGPTNAAAGCAGCQAGKAALTLDNLGRRLADLFLFGLSVMVPTAMSRIKPV